MMTGGMTLAGTAGIGGRYQGCSFGPKMLKVHGAGMAGKELAWQGLKFWVARFGLRVVRVWVPQCC